MKLCQNCGQPVAEEITTCPSCGTEIAEGIRQIDDYQIDEILHEGHASILCRATKEGDTKPVMIRIFTPLSGVNEEVADRLRRELEELKKLPAEGFVRHHSIRRSSDGLWYRISEWVDAESWGDLVGSGRLNDYRVAFDLFAKIASTLDVLHQTGHFIPHLILDDIMVIEGEKGEFEVKLDYKLSRFIDPKLDRPGPMLKHLLSCHPDIINQRPLDYRSDIWSLGKIFVELLTADYETCDFLAKVEELPLPHETEVLFKTMLADDPDLRPRSMTEVAEALARITDEDIENGKRRRSELAATSAKDISRLKKRQMLLAAIVVLLVVAGGLIWFQLGIRKKDSAAVLEYYANQYARSVAFVVVDYSLWDDKTMAYRNRAEGTAFLADKDGYLLTNRHVACPWLEDSTLYMVINQLRKNERSPRFDYRMLLWFEGEKAFTRSAGLLDSQELADVYFLDSAFRSDGTPRLTIAGVAKPPVQTRQLVASPLKDDFAVLKIDRVPEGLKPLPLDLKMDAQKVPKLSRVVILGFPMGSRAQEASVNVSVARGHVRRSFENLLQVDASLYGGSSGGPMIDMRGKVIGIASGVAIDRAPGLLPIATPIWNMAMVLPITNSAAFLQDLKAGQIKWNGLLDLSVEAKLKQITETAANGRWAEAMAMVDKELKLSFDPSLVMAGGMMHFCAGDYEGASRLFGQSLSMDAENNLARLMLFIIDWLADRSSVNPHRQELLALDWRSPVEFLGYLFLVMEGMVDEVSALKGWDTESEKSWLYYVAGLIHAKHGDWAESERLLKEAVLTADFNSWEFFLTRAKLDQVQKMQLNFLQNEARWAEYQAEIEAFDQAIKKHDEANKPLRLKLAGLKAQLEESSPSPKDKLQVLEKILESAPDNGDVLVNMSFYSAMEEAWQQSLEYARRFLTRDSRQNASRLSMGLMEAEILHHMGRKEEALKTLEAYVRHTRDPWYRSVGECLMGKRTEESLKTEAGNSAENLITLHAALGFWAEGSGDKDRAIEHYKEALESFLDTWIEFDFARERIKSLRRPSG
ncbi:MAG: trypsin-like peptidase domain-containing protein [Desulfobacterales bacterium]|nr:trypsin-like peptidase domain-containing protein [Desulfobacterales bacterium]